MQYKDISIQTIKGRVFSVNNIYFKFLKACMELAETPIADREDGKYYHLKLKDEFIEFFGIDECYTYLGYDDRDGYELLDLHHYFNEKEIKEIELPKPLTLDMFEKIEFN